ncbi:hypothetical protein IT411_03995 [Candidatus Peregrinibacteria bacterium]|nr:hypothetical protein [Candidatus Peregrinibacteria bacterium]
MKIEVFKTFSYRQYAKLSLADRLKNYLNEADVLKVPTELVKEKFVRVGWWSGLIKASPKARLKGRKSVIRKLIRVNRFLQRTYGLRLKIYEIYRPLKQQQIEFAEITSMLRQKYPKISKKALWEKTTQFIADPNLCPPHSTGGAVDLTLVDCKTGKELDMGTKINTVDDKSAIFHPRISIKAKQNREILLTAMLSEGFAPLCTEWWHFSYGEAYWAAFYGRKRIYDKADLNL